MVEQFPFKEAVLGSSPSGLTEAPSSSGLGHEVFSLVTWVRVPMGSLFVLGSRLTVGQQPLELFILGSNPSSPATCLNSVQRT